jgi:ferredoxin
MCEFCTQHGEGQKWYLSMQNYSRAQCEQRNSMKFFVELMEGFEEDTSQSLVQLDGLRKRPYVFRFVRSMATRQQKKKHWGQIVPLEDAEQIVDLQDSIVRLPCVCRSMTTGRETRYCFGLGIDITGVLGVYPDYSESLELLDKEEVKSMLRSFDRQGMVHSVWTFQTPYIGGLCNCDQDCVPYRLQVRNNLLQTMFRAEYVGTVDWDLCNGCRKCISKCQYGAIGYSVSAKRATIEMRACYGCGVCRAACAPGAISLRPRASYAELPW